MNHRSRRLPIVLGCASVLTALLVPAGILAKEQTTSLEAYPGEPVAYVLMAEKVGPNAFADLKRQDQYLECYKGIAMLDRSSDHPILVTQCYNLRLNRLVKVYLNWSQVAAFQIVDPNLAF